MTWKNRDEFAGIGVLLKYYIFSHVKYFFLLIVTISSEVSVKNGGKMSCADVLQKCCQL